MDGIVVIILAVILYIKYRPYPDDGTTPEVERVELNPMLNPEMFHIEDAFMEVAHELGIH